MRKKPFQGYIVRSTSFFRLKKERNEATIQKKLKDGTFRVTTYREHTKFVTYARVYEKLPLALGQSERFESFVNKRFKKFEKSKKARDFTSSVQEFHGKIKTVRTGKFHIEGEVARSSHVRSISKYDKKGKRSTRRQRAAIFNNNFIDMDSRIIGLWNKRTRVRYDKAGNVGRKKLYSIEKKADEEEIE